MPPRDASEPLGLLLRRHRTRAGLTLEALAAASGVSDRTISDIERGASRTPHRRTLLALVDGLALPPEQRSELLEAGIRAQEQVTAVEQPPLTLEPARLPDFTGREQQVAQALAVLRAASPSSAQPLVLVCGPGGSGKTSFAVEVAHALGHRRLFVDMQGLGTEPLAPAATARLLLEQTDPGGARHARGVEAALRAWRAASAVEPTVVILDDVASEEQVRALHAASACPLVVTSRRSLTGLSGVHRVLLGPMAAPEAAAMLERIMPQRPAAGALAELVRLCEGVPLALRIAGNRLAAQPAWSVEDFAARLQEEDSRLAHLQAGDLAVESTLDLSYGQLEPGQAAAFERLAVVPGRSFGLAVAETAVGTSDDVLASLDALANLGLLQTLAGDRFRFHELVRLFAASRLLASAGERGAREQREQLLARLLRTAEDAAAWFGPDAGHLEGSAFRDEADAQRWLRAESENWFASLRAAALRGDGTAAVEAAEQLHWFANLWPRWGHWYDVFDAAARAARGTAEESVMLGYLSWACRYEQDDPERGLVAARRAVLTARRLRDVGWGWIHVAAFQLELGEVATAVTSIGRARAELTRAEDQEGLLQTALLLGRAAELGGDLDEAQALYRDVVAHARRTARTMPFSADLTRARVWAALAEVAWRTDDVAYAREAADEAVAVSRRLHYPLGIARGLVVRARTATSAFEAGRDAAEAAAIFDAEGEPTLAAGVREELLDGRQPGGELTISL